MLLRDARRKRDLTLVELAPKVGTDAGNLSRIERGQVPDPDLARRIVEFFGGDVDYRDFYVVAPPAGDTAAASAGR